MATPTTAGSPPPAALLLPFLFMIVLVAARPHDPAAAAACAGTGLQPVRLSKPLGFCGGQIGDSTCCGEAKDAALRRAFVDAISRSFKKQETHQDASCAALVKSRLCAVCFPSAADGRIPADTSLPATCAALAAALLSSSTEHLLSRSSAPAALPSNRICLEKVTEVSCSGMTVAPDGSGRVLVWTQLGEVRLATMPPPAEAEMQTAGPATPMQVDGSPFIDLSGLVRYDEARGLRGLISVVFHPRMDGRLFVSYTTTKDDYGAILVVEELSPGERGFKRTTVFSMDLPADQVAGMSVLDHGGQIFFRPNDPSLYLVTGHVVSADLVSSNKSSLLGKILRLHVDHDVPAGTDVEVFFSGLNIPRGCALDYYGTLYCANVDETQRELVHLIIDNNTSLATSVVVLDLERPTTGTATASIVWALRYQGSADASISGRFIYAYNFALWSTTTVESPPRPGSDHHTATRMIVACSRTSPMTCQDGLTPIVVSFAEDQNKEGVILATDGVYRIVASSLCAGAGGPLAAAPAPASGLSVGKLVGAVFGSVFGATGMIIWLVSVWQIIYKRMLEADGKDAPACFECFRDCSCSCKDNTCFCCNCCY